MFTLYTYWDGQIDRVLAFQAAQKQLLEDKRVFLKPSPSFRLLDDKKAQSYCLWGTEEYLMEEGADFRGVPPPNPKLDSSRPGFYGHEFGVEIELKGDNL